MRLRGGSCAYQRLLLPFICSHSQVSSRADRENEQLRTSSPQFAPLSRCGRRTANFEIPFETKRTDLQSLSVGPRRTLTAPLRQLKLSEVGRWAGRVCPLTFCAAVVFAERRRGSVIPFAAHAKITQASAHTQASTPIEMLYSICIQTAKATLASAGTSRKSTFRQRTFLSGFPCISF